MINNWSITDKMFLFISWDGERVSIANPESKKYWGPVQKISESAASPQIADNTGSKIKISEGKIYLEVSGRYLKIMNYLEEDLLSQLSEATLSGGEATGVVFGFSQNSPEKTILIFPGTSLFKKTEEEFLRKVNLSLYKKTTKYIPGHRYELETGSFWYIGTYCSCRGRENDYWATDYNSNHRTTSHVFSNFLPDSKKLSDILKDCDVVRSSKIESFSLGNYPKSIIFSEKSKSMADMGEELDLDISLEDSYESRVEKFMEEQKREYTFGSNRYYYTRISRLLSIFDLTPGGTKYPNVPQKVKDSIKEIITSELNYILFQFYGSKKGGISTSDSEEQQCILIRNKFKEDYFNYLGFYHDNPKYLTSLIKTVLDIDLDNLTKEVLRDYKNKPVPTFDTFQDYINNVGYYEFRDPDKFEKTIDFVYVTQGNRKMSAYLPDSGYRDLLTDIYKEALNSNGSNLDSFEIENVGTNNHPLLKFTFSVTLKDIMRHCGVEELNELPDTVKKDLVKSGIYKVKFITRSDIDPVL